MLRILLPVTYDDVSWRSELGCVEVRMTQDQAEELIEELLAQGLEPGDADQVHAVASSAVEKRQPSPILDAFLAGCCLYVAVGYLSAAVKILVPDTEGTRG